MYPLRFYVARAFRQLYRDLCPRNGVDGYHGSRASCGNGTYRFSAVPCRLRRNATVILVCVLLRDFGVNDFN